MLEIRGLEVRYGTVQAVRELDLVVGDGGSVALLGPNGAGKTSTLRAVSGLVSYRGAITFDGHDCRRLGAEALARRGLIHVPEGRRLFASLTVHENLLSGLAARAGRRGDFSVDDVYDLFPPLTRLRRRPAWTLSGGEQQMVALGRALVAAPRLLLLDEPSLGLAPIVVRTVLSALEEIRRTTPMLVVEQNTSMALRLCQEAVVMAQGEAVLRGSATEIGDRRALIDSFLGRRTIT